MKRLLIILVFAITAMSVPARAADVLDIGTSARSLGLGRCYVGMVDAGECVFGNPAGLYGSKKLELVSMYTELSGDVKYTLVGVAIPTEFGKLGIGYASNRAWDFFAMTIDTTGRPVTSEPFSYGTDMLLVDYSNKLTDNLSYGLRLKYIDKGASIASMGKGTGMNLGLGLSYRLNEYASAGLVAENVIAGGQGAIKWNNGTEEEMPFVLNIGGKYRFNEINTTVYSDISLRKTRSYEIKLGGEWNAFKPLSLRAGMEQMNPGPAEKYINYSLGVGLDLGSFRLDYAYYLDTLVQNNSRHYVSIAVSLPELPVKQAVHVTAEAAVTGYLGDLGVIIEDPDGNYKPGDYITRAGSVKIMETAAKTKSVKAVKKAKSLKSVKAVKKAKALKSVKAVKKAKALKAVNKAKWKEKIQKTAKKHRDAVRQRHR